jgi:hypothetical protein
MEMMTIINRNTGKVSFVTAIQVELMENEIAIEAIPVGDFVNPYYDFQTGVFIDKPLEG